MKKEHPGVPGGGALRAKEAMEWIMKTVFLVCGFIAIAFVLLITVYLIISGLPAIREVGLMDFLFGNTLGLHRQDRPRLSASCPLSSPLSTAPPGPSSSACPSAS